MRPRRYLVGALLLVGLWTNAARGEGFVAGPRRQLVVDDEHTANFDARQVFAADGTSVMLWYRWLDDGTDGGIVARRFAADGGPLGELFPVNERQAGFQQGGTIAMAPSGDFAVAWVSVDDAGRSVFLRRYSAAGLALGGEIDVDPGNVRVGRAVVAIGRGGRTAVAWDGNAGIELQVLSRDGLAQGERFRIANATNPALATRPSGGYWLAWRAFVRDHVELFVRALRANGAPLGPVIALSTRPIRGQGVPTLAVSAAGEVAASWSACDFQSPEASCRLYLRRLSETGAARGPEVPLSPPDRRAHDHPTLAFGSDGVLAVGWQNCRLTAGSQPQPYDCHLRARFLDREDRNVSPLAVVHLSDMPLDPCFAASPDGFRLTFDAIRCNGTDCNGQNPEGIYVVPFTRQ